MTTSKVFAVGALFISLTACLSAPLNVQAGLSEQVQNKIVARCENIESKISSQNTKTIEIKDKHINNYQGIKSKVEQFITYAEKKNVDASKLKTDLVTLETKIQNLVNAANDYQNSISETKKATCGKPETDFKTSLQSSRAKLQLVKQTSLEVRTFIQNTILSDIKAVKATIQTNNK